MIVNIDMLRTLAHGDYRTRAKDSAELEYGITDHLDAVIYKVLEKPYAADTVTGHSCAAGVSYAATPAFALAVESEGSYTKGTYSAGPTLARSGGRICVNSGAAFGLNRTTNDREVRFLMGIPF